MKFGNVLKQKREERRMTQADLAERLGVTRQNVSNYETGYKIPPLKLLWRQRTCSAAPPMR